MSVDDTPNHGDLHVDPETPRRIDSGITSADVARKEFEQHEATHEGEVTVFDVLSQAGLTGCLRSTPDSPTDLATNPDHMDGFGGE